MMVGDLQVTVVSGSAVATVVAIFDGCNTGEDELLWCGDGVPVADSFLLPVSLISGWGGVEWGGVRKMTGFRLVFDVMRKQEQMLLVELAAEKTNFGAIEAHGDILSV
ncbi:Hypothetical predicted protein [Olea europaea subsp. europaea]|uniref:Uncharacterized protein n=1 Tax=Olea europaea subsp. europaea TaxID=158383 RepID=A0A8S0VMF7_OLEEU|nr:Hypothetical predicted protein [Olea europaea subsp. europaea]